MNSGVAPLYVPPARARITVADERLALLIARMFRSVKKSEVRVSNPVLPATKR